MSEPVQDMGPNGRGPNPEEKLPPLSAMEFSEYNRMADHMNMFHNSFRRTWKELYSCAESGTRPKRTTLRQFLSTGLQFCHHLTMHHTIEEVHVFPLLATKMPAFKKELELLTQHKQIHEGLDKFEEYLKDCRDGEKDFENREMKRLMDTFGDVLWTHLDDEVRQLGAENMRKYWTLAELREMPF